MLKYFMVSFAFAVLLILSAALLRGVNSESPPLELFPDMDRQDKLKYQKPSEFFADGVGSRLPVAGTVPMGFEIPVKTAAQGGVADFGFSHGGDYYNSGRFGDYFGDGIPEEIEVTADLIERGRARYNINCSVCHGEAGDGMGAVANYWPTPIGNFHDPRLKDRAQVPDGAIFHAITHGKGLMGPYGGNITVRDRWAIVAYVRVLQRIQGAPDTPAVREMLKKAGATGSAGSKGE